MKKKNFKNLSLNKNLVSNFNENGLTGGGVSRELTEGCSEACNHLSIPTCPATLPNMTNCASLQACVTYGYSCYCGR
jgi:hypothetical protein